jgi:hypothetical protein
MGKASFNLFKKIAWNRQAAHAVMNVRLQSQINRVLKAVCFGVVRK